MTETTVKIVKGVGKKSGKEYIKIEIPITQDYVKVVFLDEVEKALYKATYKN